MGEGREGKVVMWKGRVFLVLWGSKRGKEESRCGICHRQCLLVLFSVINPL